MMDNQLLTLKKARTGLLASAPFFGALAMRLDLQIDPAVKTAETDGKRLAFSPDYASQLPFDVLKGVMAHEVMHCAAGHHARRGSREPGLWNAACDYAINPMIRDAGFSLPSGALFRPDFVGKSAESIYAKLKFERDQQQQQPDQGDKGAGGSHGDPAENSGCGTVKDMPGADGQPATQPELAQAQQEWQIATLQAESAAKRAGVGSAAADTLLDEIKHPAAPWRAILREFFTESAKSDFTWARPNRRYIASGLYLPSRFSEDLGEIVVAIDTSGSCSHVQAEFCEELQSIAADCQPSKIHLVYCDSAVQRVDTFEKGEVIERRTIRGGGTDFRPVFDWIVDNDMQPAALIYLTDLMGDFPQDAPAYPVLWASVETGAAPFGEIVHVDH